jgi:hypothetical protein
MEAGASPVRLGELQVGGRASTRDEPDDGGAPAVAAGAATEDAGLGDASAVAGNVRPGGRDARRSMSEVGRRNRGTWLPGLPSAPPPRRCASRVVLLTGAVGGPGKRFDGFVES